ncbi:MAG: OmpH family outer membrane protein [Lautropia sp.]
MGAALAAALASSPAAAQGAPALKIGFVRTETVLRESNLAKAAQQKIERDFSRRDKELADMAARLKSMTDKFDKDAAVMSESDRGRRQRELAEIDKDFQRKQREFREDLNQRRNEELATVLEKANATIRKFAEQEKFDLILQEAVHVSARIDITDKIVKALNAGN